MDVPCPWHKKSRELGGENCGYRLEMRTTPRPFHQEVPILLHTSTLPPGSRKAEERKSSSARSWPGQEERADWLSRASSWKVAKPHTCPGVLEAGAGTT